MTADEMTKHYFAEFGGRNIVVDNAYVGTCEMDICSIKPSGYWEEIEIKVSKSDFLADFKKTEDIKRYGPWLHEYGVANGVFYGGTRNGYIFETVNKHERIQQGCGHANSFQFMMPIDLANELKDQIPMGYGLLGVDDRYISRIIRPMKFHSVKISDEQRLKIITKAYHRYWQLKTSQPQPQKEAA